jgi:hypothetical protein
MMHDGYIMCGLLLGVTKADFDFFFFQTSHL